MRPTSHQSACREDSATAVLERAVRRLQLEADGVCVRQPLVDLDLPRTSDLDLLVFGRVPDLLPQRLHLPRASPQAPPIDLIWLPTASLDDPGAFATNGVLPHRLLSSKVVHDPSDQITRQVNSVRDQMFQPAIQSQRIAGFLDLGFLTVREIGITWDFPALASFWLQMAYATCLAALSDATGLLCPNIYTRPLEYAGPLQEATGMRLVEPFVAAFRLNQRVDRVIVLLRRLRAVISARFPEPDWPAKMRISTRHEYCYFLEEEELVWRIRVAEEMRQRGREASGVWYLRFLAYCLARIPMVHQRALEGIDVSFLRPELAVRPELERLCPEILDDLSEVLGDDAPLTVEALKDSLEQICQLRDRVLGYLRGKGMCLPEMRDWRPFEGPPKRESISEVTA